MPPSLRGQANFLSLPEQNPPLAGWNPLPLRDLRVLGPGPSQASHQAPLVGPQGSYSQAPGSAFHRGGHPPDRRATTCWDLTTQAPPGPKGGAGRIMTQSPVPDPSNTEGPLHGTERGNEELEPKLATVSTGGTCLGVAPPAPPPPGYSRGLSIPEGRRSGRTWPHWAGMRPT